MTAVDLPRHRHWLRSRLYPPLGLMPQTAPAPHPSGTGVAPGGTRRHARGFRFPMRRASAFPPAAHHLSGLQADPPLTLSPWREGSGRALRPCTTGSAPHPRPPPSEPLPSGRWKAAEPAAAGGTFAGLSPGRTTRHRRCRPSLVQTGRSPRRRRGRQVVGGGARSTVAQAPRGFVVGGVSRNLTLALRSAGAALHPLVKAAQLGFGRGRRCHSQMPRGRTRRPLLAARPPAPPALPPSARGGRAGARAGSSPAATLTRGRSGGSGPSTTPVVCSWKTGGRA
jgi:hypothetical protein